MQEPRKVIAVAPSPRYAKAYLDGLADEVTLTTGEKWIITLILDLQRAHDQGIDGGFCYASQQYIGSAIGLSARHVRRLIRSVNRKHFMGLTDWKIAVRIRRGRDKANLMRVIVPDRVRRIWSDPERAIARRAIAIARRGAKPPAPTPPDELAGTLFAKSIRVNLFAAAAAGDSPAEKLVSLVQSREIAGVVIDGKQRDLVRVSTTAHTVYLHLAVPGRPGVTEPHLIPMLRLGGLEFLS